jgi:hypothetical protein
VLSEFHGAELIETFHAGPDPGFVGLEGYTDFAAIFVEKEWKLGKGEKVKQSGYRPGVVHRVPGS